MTDDNVEHPPHYTNHPSGVECIDVVRWFNFNRGGAMKYIWRAGEKDPSREIEDLKKAIFLLEDEVGRLESQEPTGVEVCTTGDVCTTHSSRNQIPLRAD